MIDFCPFLLDVEFHIPFRKSVKFLQAPSLIWNWAMVKSIFFEDSIIFWVEVQWPVHKVQMNTRKQNKVG